MTLSTRLIPCLLLKNGFLVRSEKFSFHQIIGNPVNEAERFNSWNADELIYLDISDGSGYDLRRDDMNVKSAGDFLTILKSVAEKCFMPLTVGGGIRTLEDIRERLKWGADKVTINTKALDDPFFIKQASEIFGSQAIVVSIDYKNGEVFKDHGRFATGWSPPAWARECERLGAGEIFLNSIDRDGTGDGYDLETIRSVSECVSIPVIACGGVGSYEDFIDGIVKGKAHAVSAANIFHFKEMAYANAKKVMEKANLHIRKAA